MTSHHSIIDKHHNSLLLWTWQGSCLFLNPEILEYLLIIKFHHQRCNISDEPRFCNIALRISESVEVLSNIHRLDIEWNIKGACRLSRVFPACNDLNFKLNGLHQKIIVNYIQFYYICVSMFHNSRWATASI